MDDPSLFTPLDANKCRVVIADSQVTGEGISSLHFDHNSPHQHTTETLDS